jgi:serine phosphatase RsbU (regulator of sigma subunit)
VRETSGDFYDIFELHLESQQAGSSKACQNGSLLYLAVGDVQGKGIGAALVAAMTVAALRSAFEQPPQTRATGASPAAILEQVSRLLYRSVGPRNFVCCALAAFETTVEDGRGPRLRLANAGQVRPLLCRNDEILELFPEGERLPLAVPHDHAYVDVDVQLQPGDVIAFVSDGLVEAPGRTPADAGEFDRIASRERRDVFGFERLSQSVTRWSSRGASANAILEGIWSDVIGWTSTDIQHDDVTLAIIRVPHSDRTVEDGFSWEQPVKELVEARPKLGMRRA